MNAKSQKPVTIEPIENPKKTPSIYDPINLNQV